MMTDTVKIQTWIKSGGMLINTRNVEHDSPMHPYNILKSRGLVPEDYGIIHPLYAEFEGMTRSDLIDEVIGLRKALDGYVKQFG